MGGSEIRLYGLKVYRVIVGYVWIRVRSPCTQQLGSCDSGNSKCSTGFG